MVKRILGYLIVTYLILNVLMTIGVIYLMGVNLLILPGLIQVLYITVFLLSGAGNWINGKPWGNPHKELQEELAKTKRWE